MSIRELSQKIKGLASFWPYIATSLAILLITAGSFEAGRVYQIEGSKEPITIEETSLNPNGRLFHATSTLTLDTPLKKGGQYVATVGGKAYYFPWCLVVKRFKPDSLLYFDSRDE